MRIKMLTAVSAAALLFAGAAVAETAELKAEAGAAMDTAAPMDAAAETGTAMEADATMDAEAKSAGALSLASYLDAEIRNAEGADIGDIDDVQITDDWSVAAVVISDDTVLDIADKSATVEPDALTVAAGDKGVAEVTVATTISDLIPQGDATDAPKDEMEAGLHSARDALIAQGVFNAEGDRIASVHDAIIGTDGTIATLVLSDAAEGAPLGRLVGVDAAKFSFRAEEPGVQADLTEAELDAMTEFSYDTSL